MLEYLSLEAHSFPRAYSENCELRGPDNVPGQISQHMRLLFIYYMTKLVQRADN